MHHGFGEKTIPIVGGDALGADVIVRRAVKETSDVLEDEFGGPLDNEDAFLLGVILMGNAIVEGLENDALVVFGKFQRDHLARWEQSQAEIANTLIECCGGKKEGRVEMLVGEFRAFEFPGNLCHGRQEVAGGFRAT